MFYNVGIVEIKMSYYSIIQ